MTQSLTKQLRKLLAASLAIASLATVGASALNEGNTTGVLNSGLNSSVGSALTSNEVVNAEQALTKKRAEAEAKAKAEAEAKAKAAKVQQYNELLSSPISAKTVAYSSTLAANDAVKSNAKSLGNYKLSFYCPCATCNGRSDAKTASGTTASEGRTIAVDSSVIPLGSRVYIDGYGVFIAEDTGGAIKNSKIDVFVSSHDRAYDLGIKYADVYLLG